MDRILGIADNYEIDTRLYCRYLRETDQEVGAESLKAWAGFLVGEGYAAATVNRRISAIRSRIRTLFEESGDEAFDVLALYSLERDLKRVHGMKINSKAVDPSKVLTADEVRAVIAKCSLRIGLIVEFLYTTGCRISEALGVRRKDVRRHRENVVIRIVGKGSKERVVRITVGLFSRITQTHHGKEFLFVNLSGEPYTRQYIERVVHEAGEAALGRRVTPHCLRHSFATETIERTGKIKGVSKYLGHSSTTTTMDMYNQEQLDFVEVPEL